MVNKKVVKKAKKKVIVKKIIKKPTVKKPKQKQESCGVKWKCSNCGNIISETADYIVVMTTKKGKVVEEVIFHTECWKEYFNQCVIKKAKQNVANIQKKVMTIIDNPILKGLLSQVKGSDNLMTMLNSQLIKNPTEKEVNNNGRTRAKKNTTKI